MFPFRHRGFDQDSPSWDLHQRAAVLGYEITGRDDKDTPTSVGAWKEDTDTRGDLNCANYWQADYSKRPVGCWGFGYASVIDTKGTGGTSSGTVDTQTAGSSNPKVLPLGQNGNKDTRFNPKYPIIVQPEGSSGDDPNSPNAGMGGDPGNGGAGGQAGNNGDGSGDNGGGSQDLGGGWQYQDGALAYFGPTSQTTDSLSGFNGGYWGGSIGFKFTGNGFNNSTSSLTGIPGIGFGGSIGFKLSGGSR
jgi:hypothetical protein